MRGQGVSDHRHFVRLGVEQPTEEVFDLRGVHRQQGEAGVEFLPGFVCRLVVFFTENRVGPFAILGHLADNSRHLSRVRIEHALH